MVELNKDLRDLGRADALLYDAISRSQKRLTRFIEKYRVDDS